MVPFHQVAPRHPHDRADRLLLVERRQHEADGQAGLLLEPDEAVEVAEFAMVEVRLAEPALDPLRDRARFVRRAFGRGEGLGSFRELVEGGLADRFPRLDDDDGLLGPRCDRFGQCPEEVGLAVAGRRRRRGAHDHDVGSFGLAQNRVPDVHRFNDGLVDVAGGVLADEAGKGTFGLRADALGDAGWDHVQGDHLAVGVTRQGIGEMDGQLGVRAAPDRYEDAAHLRRAALLDHRDLARRLANYLVYRRAEN